MCWQNANNIALLHLALEKVRGLQGNEQIERCELAQYIHRRNKRHEGPSGSRKKVIMKIEVNCD